MKPYPSYNDSGVEWIGEIPSGWDKKKLSYVTDQIGSGTTPKSDNELYYQNGTIPWMVTGDLNDGDILYVENKVTELAMEKHSSLKLYKEGSVSIAMYGATIGKLGFIKIPVTVNQANCVFVLDKDNFPKFWFYVFMGFRPQIISLGYGGGQPNISQDLLKSLRFGCPDKQEQQQISNYLDHKTGQIDTLIENTQQKIELLKEQRTSLINRIVTKGLIPNVEMKDSGVEWIGDIPSGWEITKFKFIGEVIIGLSYKPNDIVDEHNGTLVMRSSNIQNGKPSFLDNVYVKTEISEKLRTKEGDILICSRNGSQKLIGKNCVITKDIEGMSFGVFMTIFRSQDWEFVYWVLNSQIFKSQSGLYLTSTINQLTVSTLKNFIIPFTRDSVEQQEIVDYLDKETTKIDSLIEKENQRIDLLKEYRQSLISEVVTGKVDVRDEVFV